MVAALGAGWKRRMVAGGVPADKIVVTGHPDQDRWYQARQRAARCVPAIRSSLGIPVGRRLVTIAAPALAMRGARGSRRGDISLADLSASLRDAVAAVAQLGSEWLPVVKVHPRDAVGDLSFLTDAAPDVRIVHDVATDDLIVASEAMACQWSTTALIGPAVGTPVVLFDFHDSTSAEVWRGIPGLPVAKSPANFSHLLREVLLQPSSRDMLRQQQRAFVNDYLCCDGRCTQRLVELVLRRSEPLLVATRRRATPIGQGIGVSGLWCG